MCAPTPTHIHVHVLFGSDWNGKGRTALETSKDGQGDSLGVFFSSFSIMVKYT